MGKTPKVYHPGTTFLSFWGNKCADDLKIAGIYGCSSPQIGYDNRL
jgi:hypothetical protein